MNDKIIIGIKDFEFSYRPTWDLDRWILRIHDFDVHLGHIYIVSGSNMSGKSTVLNIFSGIETAIFDRESAKFLGKNVTSSSFFRDAVVFLSNEDKMFTDFSVWENIRISLKNLDRGSENKKRDICKKFFGESEILSGISLDMSLSELSTGGQALVKLCRAMVSDKQIIVIDELTSYLDDERAEFFLDQVVSFSTSGAAILIVSHNERDKTYLRRSAKDNDLEIVDVTIQRKGNVSEVHVND